MITNHTDLAKHLVGKRILLLNSLGKESSLILEWLYSYAKPEAIISLHMAPFVQQPGDKAYQEYQKNKYPEVLFLTVPNTFNCSKVFQGVYQDPVEILTTWNAQEFDLFEYEKMAEDFRKQYQCDYIAMGMSRYESFDRACFFRRIGLLDERTKQIYPLGMMSKKQVFGLIKSTGIKLHPIYKYAKSTLDHLTWYKMRSAILANPDYYNEMLKYFPLFALDKYRWEVLLGKK